MSLEQDVAAAHGAVDDLEAACTPLTRPCGGTVDARRLRIDVARLRDTLALLCGSAGVARDGRASSAILYADGSSPGPGEHRRAVR